MTKQLVSSYEKALAPKEDRTFEVVLVNYDRDGKGQTEYVKKSKIKFPTVKLAGRETSPFVKAFKAKVLPTLVAVDPDGKLITRDPRRVLEMMAPKAVAK